MTERRYLIVIKGGEDPAYPAYAPELPGCIATGATLEECERKCARDRFSRRGAP
jgi:predicted RNase H-like HicB family nuclease